jgi:hypothetical protein
MAIRIVVVLPAPLEPQNPNIDPGATAKLTPSRTWFAPKLLRSSSNSSTRPPAVVVADPDGIEAVTRFLSRPDRLCGVIEP